MHVCMYVISAEPRRARTYASMQTGIQTCMFENMQSGKHASMHADILSYMHA